jgi:hypothetical protein
MFNLDKWQVLLPELSRQYAFGMPFPNIVLDDFLGDDTAERAYAAFPTDIEKKGWIHWLHFNEHKHGLNNILLLPAAITDVINCFNSATFVDFLEKLTGIKSLTADHTLEGGGVHLSQRGGYLNIHTDFSSHPKFANLSRRLNVILYLNKNWLPEYKGELEFWSKDMKQCEKKIAPLFNRLVVFTTDQKSFHGFPDPIRCPEGDNRKSIALYYYAHTEGQAKVRSTNYQLRPGEKNKTVPNWIDNKLIWVYTSLKRTLKLNDSFVSSILDLRLKKAAKKADPPDDYGK